MSNSRELLLSKYGSFKQVVHTDSSDPNTLIVEDIQNLEPIIERAKALSDRSPVKGETFRHIGFMPAFFWNKAVREGWLNDEKELKKRFINNPELKAFRTWPGTV